MQDWLAQRGQCPIVKFTISVEDGVIGSSRRRGHGVVHHVLDAPILATNTCGVRSAGTRPRWHCHGGDGQLSYYRYAHYRNGDHKRYALQH